MTVKNIICLQSLKVIAPPESPTMTTVARQHNIIHVRVIPEPVAPTVTVGAVVDED